MDLSTEEALGLAFAVIVLGLTGMFHFLDLAPRMVQLMDYWM